MKNILEVKVMKEKEKEAVGKYGFSRATYYRAKKRGYFCPGYHIKKYDIAKLNENEIALAYKIARVCAHRYFPAHLEEDLIQEDVLEIFLKAGQVNVREGKILFCLACQGMRNFLYRYGKNHTKCID